MFRLFHDHDPTKRPPTSSRSRLKRLQIYSRTYRCRQAGHVRSKLFSPLRNGHGLARFPQVQKWLETKRSVAEPVPVVVHLSICFDPEITPGEGKPRLVRSTLHRKLEHRRSAEPGMWRRRTAPRRSTKDLLVPRFALKVREGGDVRPGTPITSVAFLAISNGGNHLWRS